MSIIYVPKGKALEYAPLAANLYTGCSHGCLYCVAPNTLILMANGTTKRIKDIKVGDEIYGVKKIRGFYRYVKTKVLAHWSSMQHAQRIELRNGISVVCSADHRWLTNRGDWKYTLGATSGFNRRPHLTKSSSCRIMGIGKMTDSSRFEDHQVKQVNATQGFLVKSIRPLRDGRKFRLYDITTGTENFIANGLISHNCFGPSTLRQTRDTFHNEVAPKANVLERFKKDAEKLGKQKDDREILLSFVTDPYQPLELTAMITREAIKILIENDLRFTILTKGGTRAGRDFDLLQGYNKCSFGSSLVFDSVFSAYHWEPGAPTPVDRLVAIQTAKKMGIKTWVSLEPVIEPEQALNLVRLFHDYIDHWKIGKVNYVPEIEREVDWIRFRGDVTELLEKVGASYYLKKSLTEL